ncbi:hypothetical protein SAMN05216345_104130 [Cupriavidus sp. YR651]|uniref:hypothetical protein n=1 Tax=Cupriavidus sp. YR651 TaxID=1855315 RepID=UPI0008904BF7|nr:hypothetical protein [Cupriavidus sp. YR651]SDC84450.1 hypothetical protein SAMN05216345_104130 [Cupriavidus sp. YR651]
MARKPANREEAEQRHQTVLNTAQAQAAALHGMYRETLGTFLATPGAVPMPRAARAMFWLGRLRQWRAIHLDGGEICSGTHRLTLQLGVVEAVAGTHALALHREQWSGPHRRQTYERDMALQIAMLIALGWRDLATFALQAWFSADSELTPPAPIGGVAGMIVAVASQALGNSPPIMAFQRSETLLADIVEHWHSDDATFTPLSIQLAERHLAQCRLDTEQSLFDFDHPVEQAMPVELLMLLRLRDLKTIPAWLAEHTVLRHPIATLADITAPIPSQRCIRFAERVSGLLPSYTGLLHSIEAQALRLREP